ncbi:aldehyde dehydrogenase family protein [Actinokineospora sp. UTMC 2448]|uniref:aldehyde dehydrogenase family protein n=1 Tax=Actinokineospora sp. UTMC 2448 TaxID=2268449 RepID=UPI0037BE9A14
MGAPRGAGVIPYWVAGRPVTGPLPLATRAGTASWASEAHVEHAVAAAWAARGLRTPARVRADALAHVSAALAARAEEAAALITAESGKPIRWSRAEITRAVATFRWGAEEARRFSGTVQRLDTDAGSDGRVALVRRVARGPVLGITPFNFPVNLVAHKLAPAIAAGAPVVIKPAPATPLSALFLGSLLAETDLPEGTWSVLPVPNADAARLAADPRLPVVSFTGSDRVGHLIRDANPAKHVLLELGGNAAAVVCPDWTDLAWAAERIADMGTYQAGQSCVSVQRVYAHREVYGELVEALRARMSALSVGDPRDPATHVGPLIDDAAAARVADWIADAVSRGATLLAGGTRTGRTVAPTLLADVPDGCAVLTEEVFGPVVVVSRVDSLDEAIARVNASRYGLQAGVFTHDLRVVDRVAAELEVGGVIIGDVPTYRADQMPYGGVKDSGTGREGVAAAMEDLTEPRVLVMRGLGY